MLLNLTHLRFFLQYYGSDLLREGHRRLGFTGGHSRAAGTLKILAIMRRTIGVSRDRYRLMPTDTIVDVGANIGSFSIYAAQQSPQGKIIALEPDAENYQLFKENLELNQSKNVVPLNMALYSKEGEMSLSMEGANASLVFGDKQIDSQLVQTISLKKIMSDHDITQIDFLKMDCEGTEFDVFYSLDPDRLGRIHKISMEYHNSASAVNSGDALSEFLKKHGFEIDVCEGFWTGLLRPIGARRHKLLILFRKKTTIFI